MKLLAVATEAVVAMSVRADLSDLILKYHETAVKGIEERPVARMTHEYNSVAGTPG